LDALQAKGFINEERVLESLIHRRAPKLGTNRIRQELESKGLAPEAIRDAVATLRSTEVERARAVWEKKFGKSEASAAPAERAKQMRFLAARGFSGDVIRKVTNER
jgi:regulatory protein